MGELTFPWYSCVAPLSFGDGQGRVVTVRVPGTPTRNRIERMPEQKQATRSALALVVWRRCIDGDSVAWDAEPTASVLMIRSRACCGIIFYFVNFSGPALGSAYRFGMSFCQIGWTYLRQKEVGHGT